MPLVNIDTVGALGIVKDEKDYRLDPNAWTDGINVRVVDGEVWQVGGREPTFGVPPVAPYFLMPFSTPVQDFWLWAGLQKAYVWDGGINTEITRTVGGDYGANSADDWSGIVFNGLPILNNGFDVPQYWADGNIATDLADLPNWPADWRAKIIRSLGPYLVAIHVTKAATVYPHMVKWSHFADPGTVPDSWDETNPTKDTGETDLPDVQSGVLMDAQNLRGQLFIYKQGSVWRMRYIGGNSIFAFDTFLETTGVLGARCVATTPEGQRHVVVTQDDVIVHNGATAESIIDKKMRRYLFSQIDPENYKNTFVVTNTSFKEVWICYPQLGDVNPTRALIWNSQTGGITETEVGFAAAATGSVVIPSPGLWSTVNYSWAEANNPWSDISRHRMIAAKPSTAEFLMLEEGERWSGAIFRSFISRTGLGILGQKRDGSPIVDFNRRKMVKRVYPRVSGGPIRVRLATQDIPEGPVKWSPYYTFDPDTQKWVDIIVEGAAIGIEFSSFGNPWKIEGYKLDLIPTGEF